MKRILPILVFLLAACLPSPAGAPAPTQIQTSEVSPSTATQTPVPAALPEAIKIDPATGKCMYYGGAEGVECDADSIVIGEDGSFAVTLATGETIKTVDGKTWTSVNNEAGAEITPNVIPDWEMGCYKADMCMGLEAKDGAKLYNMLAEGFVVSYENRAWMASMGIDDIDGFRNFLKNSKHTDPVTGQERAGWIPLTAKDKKSTFKILQGNGSAANGIFSDKNPAIVEAGGFFFDHLAFVAASKTEMDANTGGVADWVKKMEEQNGNKVLIRTSSIPGELWGLVVVDGQLVFVALNNATPPDNFPQKDRILGQPEAKKNGQIMSAYWELYTRIYRLFGNSRAKDALSNSKIEPDFNKWYSPQLCVAGTSGMCEGKSPSNFASDPWFVPAE